MHIKSFLVAENPYILMQSLLPKINYFKVIKKLHRTWARAFNDIVVIIILGCTTALSNLYYSPRQIVGIMDKIWNIYIYNLIQIYYSWFFILFFFFCLSTWKLASFKHASYALAVFYMKQIYNITIVLIKKSMNFMF